MLTASAARERAVTGDALALAGIEAAAYVIPTDGPAADGTLTWNETMLVLATARAGGEQGSAGPMALPQPASSSRACWPPRCWDAARSIWLHAHVGVAVPNLRYVEFFHDHQRIERLPFDGALDAHGVLTPSLASPVSVCSSGPRTQGNTGGRNACRRTHANRSDPACHAGTSPEGCPMKVAPGLTLIAIGAIFTFAITTSPSWLNLQIVGVVLMATGAAALLLPQRAQGWIRRRMVVRRGPRGPVVSEVDETMPPYIMLNPGATADGSEQPGIPVERTVIVRPNDRPPPSGTEVVDEYLEE